jgi:hypothetical protein
MTQYFISGASEPMEAGATVEWEFGDVGVNVLTEVVDIGENRRIAYESGARR